MNIVSNNYSNPKEFCESLKRKNFPTELSDQANEKIASFIKYKLPSILFNGNSSKNYFKKKELGIGATVEYDPESNQTLVHYKQKRLGEGWSKKSSFSVIYDPSNPRPVVNLILKSVRNEASFENEI